MNDVIRLDELGVCAVGICSNKATEQQIEMLTKFARQVANNRVMLFPDQDEEGTAGFKDLLWSLAERKLAVSLANPTDNDEYQPEDLKNWLC